MSINVTFSCNVLSRWAQLVGVFSSVFKFSLIVIYRAKSRRSELEWGDLLTLLNRNNCSLLVGAFSFSLICESIAAQFLTFVPHGEQTLVVKDSPSSRRNKHICELIYPLLKLPYCFLKFHNLSEALGSFGFLPLRRAGTGFVGVLPLLVILILHYICYIPQRSNAKNCFRASKIRSQVQTIIRAILPRKQSPSVSNSQRVNRFLTARRHFLIPWSERTPRMESGQSVFFLSPSYATLYRFFYWFWGKNRLFCSLAGTRRNNSYKAKATRRQLGGRHLLFGEYLRSWKKINVHYRRWT